MTADTDRIPPAGQAGGNAESARSFAMLLDVGDFDGPGWVVTDERWWPTGQLDAESDKSRRALASGGVTAWRSLDQRGHRSAAWVEVVPYASAADAEVSLDQVPGFFTGAGRAGDTLRTQRVVEDQKVPGCPRSWIFEKSTTGPGGDHWSRYAGVTVDRHLVLACFTRWGSPWPWAEALDQVARQVERVRTAHQDQARP